MADRLTPGTSAPDFTLPDAHGRSVSLRDLRGDKVIVYFYPRAATPGCTTQACDFRDSMGSLVGAGYRVLGISPDTPEALGRFAADHELEFPLLSDPDHRVAEAWGAWGEKKNYGKVYEGLIRSTVVLDEEGRVNLAQYNVRAKGHVAKLRRDLGLES